MVARQLLAASEVAPGSGTPAAASPAPASAPAPEAAPAAPACAAHSGASAESRSSQVSAPSQHAGAGAQSWRCLSGCAAAPERGLPAWRGAQACTQGREAAASHHGRSLRAPAFSPLDRREFWAGRPGGATSGRHLRQRREPGGSRSVLAKCKRCALRRRLQSAV